jgi:hypothetical protein
MNQSLDPEAWPPICFEGKLLPQSLKGISILIDRKFTERTGDWIWRLSHCYEVWKEGESGLCIASATEIMDHLLEHRADVARGIRERLGSHGFDGDATLDEWLTALAHIQSLAKSSKGVCRWIAGNPTEEAQEALRGFSSVLDRQAPLEE